MAIGPLLQGGLSCLGTQRSTTGTSLPGISMSASVASRDNVNGSSMRLF